MYRGGRQLDLLETKHSYFGQNLHMFIWTSNWARVIGLLRLSIFHKVGVDFGLQLLTLLFLTRAER